MGRPGGAKAASATAGRAGKNGLGPLLDHAFALYPLEQALRDVICPCLVGIGELWERGELSVGQEHLATAAIRARLERTLAEPRGAVRGLAVLACAPGEQPTGGTSSTWASARRSPTRSRSRKAGRRRCSRSA